jgi:hypothetical protein
MSDGDFGGDASGDAGGSDGGPFDLNNNGTSADEFILFAAMTDHERSKRASSSGQVQRSGCLLPTVVVALLAVALLAL